jgi:hypothetical protein
MSDSELSRLSLYLRGFVRAWPVSAAQLCGMYLALAIEQAEKASMGRLTQEEWMKLAARVWQERKG